jgi:hypothetical protein
VIGEEPADFRFEWDENKNASNLSKHGVSFADAALVFFDDDALIESNAGGEGEPRFQVIGSAAGLVVLFVAYTGKEPGWRRNYPHHLGPKS